MGAERLTCGRAGSMTERRLKYLGLGLRGHGPGSGRGRAACWRFTVRTVRPSGSHSQVRAAGRRNFASNPRVSHHHPVLPRFARRSRTAAWCTPTANPFRIRCAPSPTISPMPPISSPHRTPKQMSSRSWIGQPMRARPWCRSAAAPASSAVSSRSLAMASPGLSAWISRRWTKCWRSIAPAGPREFRRASSARLWRRRSSHTA